MERWSSSRSSSDNAGRHSLSKYERFCDKPRSPATDRPAASRTRVRNQRRTTAGVTGLCNDEGRRPRSTIRREVQPLRRSAAGGVADTDARVLRHHCVPIHGPWAAGRRRTSDRIDVGGPVGASYIFGAAVLADVGSPVLSPMGHRRLLTSLLALGSALLVKPRRRVDTPLASFPPT